MQALSQEVLEAEATELLGRARYQRRAALDGPGGYCLPRDSSPLGGGYIHRVVARARLAAMEGPPASC